MIDSRPLNTKFNLIVEAAMPLRPNKTGHLADPLSNRVRRCASAMLGCCLLSTSLLVGCHSLSPGDLHEARLISPVPSMPPISSVRPTHSVLSAEKWSSQTRDGRAALLEREFDRAEVLFLAALTSSTSFRSRDIRVDVSFGNLVRLASIYERTGRQHDAERLIAEVESSAGRRRISSRRIANYRARYETLAASALDRRLEPFIPPAPKESAPYDRLIRRTANSFDIDPALVKAVVATESNFEPEAVSRVGAQGLMQLMPATARAMGVERPFKPSENIRGGVRYLRTLLDRFEKVELALAAYNAGPEAVLRHGGIPPYPETEAYVTKVLSRYRRYQAGGNR